MDWTKEKLIAFEDDVKKEFLAGNIRYPVHFSRGNEIPILKIFKQIKAEDWVFASHRNHYAALLKGIPPEWLKSAIMRGNSMHLMNKEYKFFASSIVGGSVPIAVGVAMAIKRKGLNEHVWCFLGDMASFSGIFHESTMYAKNFDLPISFVIECNGLSTNSPSYETINVNHIHDYNIRGIDSWGNGKVLIYCYERGCPHINVGQFVVFR